LKDKYFIRKNTRKNSYDVCEHVFTVSVEGTYKSEQEAKNAIAKLTGGK